MVEAKDHKAWTSDFNLTRQLSGHVALDQAPPLPVFIC